jgi:GNAT superfamily N-acetyltransferase
VKPGVEIVIRPAIADDTAFILREWLRTFCESPFAAHIDRATFFREHHRVATMQLGRGAVVAALPDARDVLCGFLAGAGEVLHYAYVKPQFRRMGIASEMVGHVFGDSQITYTHWTPEGRALLSKRVARYSPYA